MEEKINLPVMKKPEFNEEITANIKTLGEIESNIKDVKNYVIELKEYYKNIIFTEETMKDAKDEKSKVNKFKKVVSDYRKSIVNAYNEPIKVFEDTAKETEKLLTETYTTINEQVADFENKQKEEKELEIRTYFEEYAKVSNIDFVRFEQTGINVTLTASKKSLKDKAKEFIDRIIEDLCLIETQEHKAEILVEYKQSLNVSNAITVVVNRFKAIEEQKKKMIEEEIRQKQEAERIEMENNLAKFAEPEEKILEAPTAEIVETVEEIISMTFTVKGTLSELKKLKQFLNENQIEIVN